MPVLNMANKEQVQKYNNFVRNCKGASLMQDLAWGKVKKDWKQEAVYIEENSKIVAAMTILLEKVPGINSYLMYSPRGPVGDIKQIEDLIKEAEPLVKKYNAFLLKFDPEIKNNESLIKDLRELGYKVLDKDTNKDSLIQPIYNMILDIENKTQEDLLKQFSEKTRYNIKLARKKGVNVRYSHSKEDLKIFYELYKVTTIRDKIGCRAYEYFETLLDSYDNENIRIYIASHEEDNLSAAIAINYGGKLFYIYGASSNEKRNLMPNYLLQWEMICWGLETKCNNYDFGGVLILDKENGLYKFKSGFCKKEGVTEYIGEVDVIYKKHIYYMYTKGLPLMRKFIRFVRKLKLN